MKYELTNFCEIDAEAIKSYCAIHNVNPEKNLGNVELVDETKIEPFNFMIGGSPCQDFSISSSRLGVVWHCNLCGKEYNPLTVKAEKRHFCPQCGGIEISKTRSSLLVEWLRIFEYIKPDVAIYENVKNILSSSFKEMFGLFVQELKDTGYIQILYSEWCAIQKKMVEMYNDKEVEYPPIWENDNFKKIKNAVIREAVQLDSDSIFLTDGIDDHDNGYEPEDIVDYESEYEDDTNKQSYNTAICDYRGIYGKIRKQLEGTDEFEYKYEILMKEIERNNAPAFVDVGRLYEKGIGVEQNQDMANQYYEKALNLYLELESEEENPFFEYQIAKLYRMETDFGNHEKSVKFYTRAAEKGNRYAMYALGNAYFFGKGTEVNYENAYEWYQESTYKGLPYAYYRLGDMLRKGQGCEENTELANEYYSRAIVNMTGALSDEDYVSHYRLGKLFERGWGTESDLEKAMEYYEKASRYDYAQAEFALARIYLRQGDSEKGDEYIKRAIEHGDTYAEEWYEEYKEYQREIYMPKAAMSALNLFCRLAEIIDNDTKKHIDGHNKTIVDSKERRELAIKKQRLGIKMV